MKQTRITSLIEVVINTIIGFVVSYVIWPLAATNVGIEYTTEQHWKITAIFTIAALVRGYVIRRFFNTWLHRIAQKISRELCRYAGKKSNKTDDTKPQKLTKV